MDLVCVLKIKTGVQWHLLPLNSMFRGEVLHYKTVFEHYQYIVQRKYTENVFGYSF